MKIDKDTLLWNDFYCEALGKGASIFIAMRKADFLLDRHKHIGTVLNIPLSPLGDTHDG